jgi:hypothetical protein
MRFRKLRIAWSVVWGIACVLLIVLWARSYWWVNTFGLPATANRVFQVTVAPGRFLVGPIEKPRRWLPDYVSADDFRDIVVSGDFVTASQRLSYIECLEVKFPGHRTLPFWTIVFVTSILSVTPWLPWWTNRYSLRTLLIAITAIAVVMGLVVYLAR